MRKLLLILPVLVLALFGGCKKNSLPPEESSGDPVFYVKANLDGVGAIDYEAGKDGYYMNAGHSQNADNVYIYEGDLSQKTCSGTCGWNFNIQVYDYTVSAPGATMNPNEGLKPSTSFQYNDGNIEPIEFTGYFNPTFTLSLANYTWQYSDGTIEPKTFPNLSTTHSFKKGEHPWVKLIRVNGNPIELSNTFEIGNPLQVNISVDRTTYSDYNFNVSTNIPCSNYYWDFGDGNVSQLAQPSPTMTHTYPTISSGTYIATCTITSTSGNTCVTKVFVNTDPVLYLTNYTSTFTPVSNSKKLSTIVVKATEPGTGRVFSSENIDQPNTSSFEIVSIESYKENNAGDPTKKVKVKFNCLLKNGNDTKSVTNGEAVFAFSYK